MLTLFPPTQNQTKSLEAGMKFNLLFELITEKKKAEFLQATYVKGIYMIFGVAVQSNINDYT